MNSVRGRLHLGLYLIGHEIAVELFCRTNDYFMDRTSNIDINHAFPVGLLENLNNEDSSC